MGVRLQNFSIVCDYATPEKYCALELHMALPVPHKDIQKIQTWLENKNWKASEDYLIGKYPQHNALIRKWMRASQARSEENLTPMKPLLCSAA